MVTIRATTIQSSSADNYAVSWPAGTLAGDRVFIFVGGGYDARTPTNWDRVNFAPGANFQGAVFSKILSGLDITAGNVVITMGGNFNTVIAAISFVGAVSVHTPVTSSQSGSGSTAVALGAPASTKTGDTVLLFGSNRAASADTVDKGAALQTINAANASGALYAYTAPADGTFTANFAYSVAGSGNYQIAIPITDYFAPPTVAHQLANVQFTQGAGGDARVHEMAFVAFVNETPPVAGGAKVHQLAYVMFTRKRPRRLGPLVG